MAPIGARVPEWTLSNYLDFFRKGFYLTLTGRSLMLGLWVTGFCLLLGFPAALALAKLYQSTGRPAEAHAVLAPALEGFSPTPEMPEIAEAQALIERLA